MSLIAFAATTTDFLRAPHARWHGDAVSEDNASSRLNEQLPTCSSGTQFNRRDGDSRSAVTSSTRPAPHARSRSSCRPLSVSYTRRGGDQPRRRTGCCVTSSWRHVAQRRRDAPMSCVETFGCVRVAEFCRRLFDALSSLNGSIIRDKTLRSLGMHAKRFSASCEGDAVGWHCLSVMLECVQRYRSPEQVRKPIDVKI